MAKMPKFEYYPDRAGKWRWRLKAANGLILADSGQGYSTVEQCKIGIQLTQSYAPSAEIVLVSE